MLDVVVSYPMFKDTCMQLKTKLQEIKQFEEDRVLWKLFGSGFDL